MDILFEVIHEESATTIDSKIMKDYHLIFTARNSLPMHEMRLATMR